MNESELIEAAAVLRNAVYSALPPPYPHWGMGGGSAMEAAAQDRWDAKYAAGPDHVRIERAACERLFRLLRDLPEPIEARGVELARAKRATP